MKLNSPWFQAIAVLILWFFINTAHALPIPIDLNDFFADPTVTIAVDGSSATMAEDPLISPILLSNDPGLGDPNVIIPAAGTSLFFDFDFAEAAGNDDGFLAFILDAATGLSLGPAFEFSTEDSSSGTVSFDLSSLVGLTLGLQFELGSGFGDAGFDSTALVSMVRIDETPGADIPEPSVLLLMLSGLFAARLLARTRSGTSRY